ncbi:Hypothetical protein, putative [Bodo saltans]|uniref:Uncharacterized protein n=1 Tax=Bodo saltans TaxID=75058 RepID=A0A0S4IPQ3_BODSA|nr:Hypothetical protein, putative [Bodo saltans]|eukprot:CUE71564.1 Hypothetical protein, putative [Bodo saltans]
MEQRYRDLPNSTHAVGLRSPRYVDTPIRKAEVVHDVASFSPVPVSATQGVVSMDIGGSPAPNAKANNGAPYGESDFGDAPRTVAYSVNDSTMQLSDVSGEIAAAEERLAELEEKGSAAALNRGMYERRTSTPSHTTAEGGERKKQSTAPPSRCNSYLSTGAVSPINDDDSPPTKKLLASDDVDVPQARFSLAVAIQKKKQEQNRPLVSVSVEVAEGVVEHVRLYDGDTYESCKEHAFEMIEKYNLDLEFALEPLTEHLCNTLDEYRTTMRTAPDAVIGQRPNQAAAAAQRQQITVPPSRQQPHAATVARKAMPSPQRPAVASKSPIRREVQRSPMRSARTNESMTSTVADRSLHPRDTSASRLRSISGSRARQVSPTSSALLPNHNPSFAGISARYLSPAPDRPPPPSENHTHKPTLAPGTRALSSRATTATSPAHERLYSKQSEIDAKRRIAIRARDEIEAQDRQRSHSNHRVRGLSWDHFTNDDRDPGHRMHDNAVRQKKSHEEKAAKIAAERKARELEGYSFHPTINNDGVAGRTLSQRRRNNYHDPFYSATAGNTSNSREKILSTADRELQECTFQPKTNSKRTVSPRVKRPAALVNDIHFEEESVELEASDSSSPFATDRQQSQHQYHRSITPTRKVSARAAHSNGFAPSSKATSVANDVNSHHRQPSSSSSASVAQSVTNRLFTGAREREERLERARRLAQTVDSKTGKPLFTPQVHR